ncbi:PleD family two-component system response regulator [Parvularcula sp. LCG005]|uniref:PleD family two-component system response regulator n=1 Tax=Parvularcula sp. LCG005 TaxID=3078805 RepID=UPI0029434196|nr:PleD family two-component system response regulator [Parvularcula sp. LCG005]WOI52747.1 PleD family two-component system response regulator [Parvularcula sp. LCG005]
MTARVLVVDDLAPNVKLLEAKLRAEYFEVLTSLSGEEALEIAASQQPDIVLLDVMMPGLDGFEVCRRLKEDPITCHIPVVMVTALDQQSDRLAGLKAGADDFLTKPVQDVAMFARVRSLTRLKQMTDELRYRYVKGAELGAVAPSYTDLDEATMVSSIMVITDEPFIDGLVEDAEGLPGKVHFHFENDARQSLDLIRSQMPDLIMIDLALESYDPLRLCSAIRSFENARLSPLLALARDDDMRKLVRALDIGVSDYLMRPIDSQEMAARVKTQLRRKRYVEHLRQSVNETLEMAVTDPLTGLYNRRYLANHLPRLLRDAKEEANPLSLMVIDVDHFKKVNDTLGHDIGDVVLREMAQRMNFSIRGIDLACRFGGEEFVFVMPDTDRQSAEAIAERLRSQIAEAPVDIGAGDPITITVSIGVATSEPGNLDDTPQDILKRADDALYKAKDTGRNRVVAQAA